MGYDADNFNVSVLSNEVASMATVSCLCVHVSLKLSLLSKLFLMDPRNCTFIQSKAGGHGEGESQKNIKNAVLRRETPRLRRIMRKFAT